MHCTQCGSEGHGRFCANCGASLKALSCRSCGGPLPAGTRVCTACGTPVGGAAAGAAAPAPSRTGAPSGPDIGWWVAGGLLFIVIVLVGVSLLSTPEPAPVAAGPLAPAPAPSGAGAPPDLSSMTPREAADRLFNRVMTAAAQEDTAEANTFLPMAQDAYELARPLNEDGLFHLSLLQRAAGEIEASLATAEEGLQSNPDHLLNLSAAAEASLQLGNADAGVGYYQRMLEAWDREIALGRPEYEEHAPLLPLLREDAEAVVPAQ